VGAGFENSRDLGALKRVAMGRGGYKGRGQDRFSGCSNTGRRTWGGAGVGKRGGLASAWGSVFEGLKKLGGEKKKKKQSGEGEKVGGVLGRRGVADRGCKRGLSLCEMVSFGWKLEYELLGWSLEPYHSNSPISCPNYVAGEKTE